MWRWFVGILGALPALAFSAAIDRVIYITLDGVRWQDLYLTQEYFPLLWEKHAANLTFYGAPNSNTHIQVASIPISLPSYQSQLSGAVQPCDSNECGRISVETFLESLIHQYKLNKKNVATFASWNRIELAAERVKGTTYTNTGNNPVVDPDTDESDEVMYLLNQQQEEDYPEEAGVRYDKYTFAQALHYLETFQPRFLWISLNDADELAHENKLTEYQQTLQFYDQSLDTLFTKLYSLGLDERTMIIVTTDHGRGNDDDWTEHGPSIPGSEQTWAFVMNGQLKPDYVQNTIAHYSTLSIRPAVELAFRK
ncbi:MAG: hypothetical protein EPN84_13015 [Legionella sp.]|nr:MAG: hypothetical protein EPN84_13015 [Legionella sp.]